jgi:hypothetical protein
MDPRLPGDAVIMALSGFYVGASVTTGKTLSPLLSGWLRGKVLISRKAEPGMFWLFVVVVALWFLGSAYWTVRLLIWGR